LGEVIPPLIPRRRPRRRYPGIPMKPGECRRTKAGVLYCYIPELGTRFCPVDTKTAEECRARLMITGDRRRGRFVRYRIGGGGRLPELEV